MESRFSDSSRLNLSPIGISLWALHQQNSWRLQDDIDMMKSIHRGLEGGVNWFDTAPFYGSGHGDMLLARSISHMPRNEITIATKCGVEFNDQSQQYTLTRPEEFRKEIEGTLFRLETDYVDLCEIFLTRDDYPIEDAWYELIKLQDAGKIRHLGLANTAVSAIHTSEELRPVEIVSLPYSIIFREIQAELLPYCEENNIGIVAFSPVHLNKILSQLDNEDRLNRNDLMRALFIHESDEKNTAELVTQLKPIAHECDLSIAQLTIAWISSFVGIKSTLISSKQEDRVAQSIAAASITLAPEILSLIGEKIAENVGV